ncbi:hypothetical protein GW17_00037222 [Ensete ventricosum]|nr:hypothetical protein GW17_00037222 [Ensete ventricosum]
MALGSAQASLADMAATSGESVRRRAGDAVRGRSSPNGDAASSMGSLYEFRNGRGEIEVNGSGSVNQSPPSLLQQSGKPKLLTLPTVLTIGRVAAVPLLVSSRWLVLLFCIFSQITMSSVREWAASQNGRALEVPFSFCFHWL